MIKRWDCLILNMTWCLMMIKINKMRRRRRKKKNKMVIIEMKNNDVHT